MMGKHIHLPVTIMQGRLIGGIMGKESMMAERGREKVSLAGAFGKMSRKAFDLSWMTKHDRWTQRFGNGWWEAELGGDYYRMLST